jgi:hypothetical protein
MKIGRWVEENRKKMNMVREDWKKKYVIETKPAGN